MIMFELLAIDYRGEIGANDLIKHVGQTLRMVGPNVCEKTIHTKNKQKMWFGNFLDAEGNAFDIVHFPNNTLLYPFRDKICYLMLGKVVAEFGLEKKPRGHAGLCSQTGHNSNQLLEQLKILNEIKVA